MDYEKKYVLSGETIVVNGHTLHRIIALLDFSDVKKGDEGGFIESEDNLSHWDDCWVYDNAKVYGNVKVHDNAEVFGNAKVYDNAEVYGNAEVFGNAKVYDNAEVYGNVKVYGDARVYGNAAICGNAEISELCNYIVFKNWWSSGRYFTWTRSNDRWKVGCFYGSGEELIKKAYKDGKNCGREYERIVEYVEMIKENI